MGKESDSLSLWVTLGIASGKSLPLYWICSWRLTSFLMQALKSGIWSKSSPVLCQKWTSICFKVLSSCIFKLWGKNNLSCGTALQSNSEQEKAEVEPVLDHLLSPPLSTVPCGSLRHPWPWHVQRLPGMDSTLWCCDGDLKYRASVTIRVFQE